MAGWNEFVETLDVIDDTITDRDQAIAMTLATLARVQKIGKDQVVGSFDECLLVLEDERSAIEAQLAEESRQARQERQEALQTATEERARLERELEQARVAEEAAQRRVNELDGMIDSVRSRFQSAHGPMVQEFAAIRGDLE